MFKDYLKVKPLRGKNTFYSFEEQATTWICDLQFDRVNIILITIGVNSASLL